MGEKAGRYAVIEQFIADGMKYMFGNPGTVEQGFLDVLDEYPGIKYILSLQESIAVGMADGHARVTKKPTLIQLHSGVGLGNGIGMLYQAYRGHAPLVVVASESGVKYEAMDSQMAADLVGMARPVTKWAARATDPASLLRMVRRAIKIAGTPPMGPVFLALPADVLDAPNHEQIIPTSIPNTRTAPTDGDIQSAADMLAKAENPLMVIGDGVAFSGAQDEVVQVAETLGAAVWGADSSEVNIPFTHPLWQGKLGHMFGANSARVVRDADVILIVGTYVFPEVYPFLDTTDIFSPGARIIHIDLNAFEIAKNFNVDIGMVAEPKLSLAGLAGALEQTMTAAQKEAARNRVQAIGDAKAAASQAAREADSAKRDDVPLQASRFLEELAQHVPDDVIIFDEGLTTTYNPLPRYISFEQPNQFFATRGGSLGVGIPGALGIKLAHPDRTVIGFTGDGGSMYTIQALWTAARYNIGAKLVVCNNQTYMLLKLNLMQYWKEQGLPPGEFPDSFDLTSPVVDFAMIAESMGVPGLRVETPDQVGPAIKQMLEHDGPFLIDLVVSSETPDPSSGK